jgi:hypothetical protein
MAARNIQQPATRKLRLLGWILAIGMAILGRWLGPSPASLFLQLCAAAVFTIATIKPRAMTGLHSLLSWFTWPVLWLFGRTGPTAVEGELPALPRRRPRLPRKRAATS